MLRMSEVNEIDHQSMQHMLTEGSVDWDGLGAQIALEANDLLGGSDAVLIFDESGFAKKGEASAGVARQWNGRLGKVDNCQVGVFATLCRGDMATLIDTRLYLPEDWCSDEARCKKAAIPKDKRQFFSKSQLALAMLEIARQRDIHFGYVGIDGGYGKEPAFLRGVDELGCRFVADVHCDQTIYLQDPEPQVPEWSGRGRKPIHRQPQCASQRVAQWAAAQPPEAWQRLTLREGEKGLLVADYLHTLIWAWDGQEAPPVAGIYWYVAKSARRLSRTIAYPMRRWIRLGRSWHGYRHNASSLSTAFERRKANAAWLTIKCAAGMPGIIIWPWSCWEPYFWSSRKRPAANSGPCCHSMI